MENFNKGEAMSELDDEITNEIFLEELKQEFYESAAKNMKAMEKLFFEKNFEKLSEIAHDIKGTAGLFGYDEGSKIANRIVTASKNNNKKNVEKSMAELNKYMKKNKII